MTKFIFAAGIFCYIAACAATFQYNLPNWCANPNGQGNWIVQPLCK